VAAFGLLGIARVPLARSAVTARSSPSGLPRGDRQIVVDVGGGV
jgi:hypothetical protein